MELRATPTEHDLPLRAAEFSTLAEALDYAAAGHTGCNFYGDRGDLRAVVPYADLRGQARSLARRLLSLGLERGARVAIIADTHPDFHRVFFACQYAGLVPVPLPASLFMSGRAAYVAQLRALLTHCRASVGVATPDFLPYLREAAEGLTLGLCDSVDALDALPQAEGEPRPLQPHEMAYLQYTSGSTRFPRGVMITQQAALTNLLGITQLGLKIRKGDRAVSWLPFYHDMGLVGFVLGPLVSQVSVDYLSTRSFAMRPRQWLTLMSQSRATISFGPSFGYEVCARRVRHDEAGQFDLSAWRAAGVGAETIRFDALTEFAERFADSGFNKSAFLACYGMAECALAVSFAPLDQGLAVDEVDRHHLSAYREALPFRTGGEDGASATNSFVNCGAPLPDMDVEIRDEQGRALPERRCGVIFLRGPNVMSGYFDDPERTQEVLSADGWLDTGDVGYRVGSDIVIIGRKKDVIIINGRNIWPQDLEHLAEEFAEVRTGDACAFSVQGPDQSEIAVMAVQCRESDATKRSALVRRLQSLIREHLALDCHIELVPPHTLPRTSSGKLSRSKTREEFLTRVDLAQLFPSPCKPSNSRPPQATVQMAPCAEPSL